MKNIPDKKTVNPFDIIRMLIAPAGAFLALFAFLLPWASVSVLIIGANVAGYQMGMVVWLLPVLYLGIMVASFLPFIIENAWVTRLIVAGLTIFALFLVFIRTAIMIFEMFRSQAQISFHVGIPITIFGLMIALAGAALLPSFKK
ncbi:MAG TPA: hypothetical protein PKY82_02695 [Pyrinomonadaceae bacterium]|nr:hypothetical protein [Pyrinomonadaceae bacterium]